MKTPHRSALRAGQPDNPTKSRIDLGEAQKSRLDFLISHGICESEEERQLLIAESRARSTILEESLEWDFLTRARPTGPAKSAFHKRIERLSEYKIEEDEGDPYEEPYEESEFSDDSSIAYTEYDDDEIAELKRSEEADRQAAIRERAERAAAREKANHPPYSTMNLHEFVVAKAHLPGGLAGPCKQGPVVDLDHVHFFIGEHLPWCHAFQGTSPPHEEEIPGLDIEPGGLPDHNSDSFILSPQGQKLVDKLGGVNWRFSRPEPGGPIKFITHMSFGSVVDAVSITHLVDSNTPILDNPDLDKSWSELFPGVKIQGIQSAWTQVRAVLVTDLSGAKWIALYEGGLMHPVPSTGWLVLPIILGEFHQSTSCLTGHRLDPFDPG